MVKVALLVRLQAKPGKETAVASFLESALALANSLCARIMSAARRRTLARSVGSAAPLMASTCSSQRRPSK